MPQLYFLTMTVVAWDNLLANAAFCCFFAAFNRDDELAIPCLFASKDINLWNIQGKTDLGRSRNWHLFNSIVENGFHSTSSPHLGVSLVFPKNHKNFPQVMNVIEVAASLRVFQATIYRLAQAGQNRSGKVGRAWLFHKEAIDSWISEQPDSLGDPLLGRELIEGGVIDGKA